MKIRFQYFLKCSIRYLKWALFLASMTCLVIAPPAAAQPNVDRSVSLSFQPDLPSADVAVLFDASLSMRNQHYSEVRQTVITFASALTGKEMLHLRIFGDVAGAPLEGPADKVSGNIADHLPTEPIFHHTDLGAAISKSLEFFERPGANETQALFLLTDGLHDSPPGSPFSRDFAGDPHWQALRERAKTLCARHRVLVYGFGLGAQTDISLLLKVFPAMNVEVVTGSAAQVATTLRRVRENLRLVRLRQLVEQDIRTGSVETHFAQHPAAKGFANVVSAVTIHNSHQFLPVEIERIELQRQSQTGEEVSCALASTAPKLKLAPGQQWQGQLRCGLQARQGHWRIGRKERVYPSDWRLGFNPRFSNEAEIAQLTSTPVTPRQQGASLHVQLRERYGVPYWLFISLLLAVFGVAFFIRQRRNHLTKRRSAIEQRQVERTRLSGTLKIWPKDQREPNEDGMDLSKYKMPRLQLASSAEGALEIALPDAQPATAVARLSGHLLGALPNNAEAGKVEFRLEAARGHRLAYEVGGQWREASSITLCDRDLIEIDGRWRARYANHRLRTRAEVESARKE